MENGWIDGFKRQITLQIETCGRKNYTPITGSGAKASSAVTLLLSSDVSCASCSPSPVVFPCSCNDAAESGRESDAAQRSTVSSLSHLVGHELN